MEDLQPRRISDLPRRSMPSDMEVMVPTASDATFRYRWQIPKYTRSVSKSTSLDSSPFYILVNGTRTQWSLSLRFWRGPGGRLVRDPAVLCLNLVKCDQAQPQQAHVRFQMEVLDNAGMRWERVGHAGRVALQLQKSQELLSLGHRDISVRKRHLLQGGTVCLGVSVQLILTEEEKKGLVSDLEKLMNSGNGDVLIHGDDGCELRAHSYILAARSPVLATMLEDTRELKIKGISEEVLTEVLRYIYTDRVERLSSLAEQILEAARTLALQGLQDQCIHSILEIGGPQKTALHIAYPGLFYEMGSSSSSGLGSLPTSDSECETNSPDIMDSEFYHGISFTVQESVKIIQ